MPTFKTKPEVNDPPVKSTCDEDLAPAINWKFCCNLRHVTPKTLQKALYVGFSESAQPLQVVYFGWPRFPVPGSAPRMGRWTECARITTNGKYSPSASRY